MNRESSDGCRAGEAAVPGGTTGGGVAGWKRILDLALILVSSPLWVPLMVVLSAGIALVSPGPILFRQVRIGHRGRPFQCLKFRSMKVGAATAPHQAYFKTLIESDRPMTKLDRRGDHRLIPMGALLRASGLDELPQLLNVIRGEMSLVGPRPCIPSEYEQYQDWQRGRFEAVPGLTGLWQVSGKNRLTFTQMVLLDLRYVREQSVWMDLRILAGTWRVVLVQLWDVMRDRTGGRGRRGGMAEVPDVPGSVSS